MRTFLIIATASAAFAAAAPVYAQSLPTSGAISGSMSVAGSGSHVHSLGAGSANASSLAGNASTGGAATSNGTVNGGNIQVNTVETYSSTIGGTANTSSTNGLGHAGAGGQQSGGGFGAGVSYVPTYSPM